jgi:hypothetical protein
MIIVSQLIERSIVMHCIVLEPGKNLVDQLRQSNIYLIAGGNNREDTSGSYLSDQQGDRHDKYDRQHGNQAHNVLYYISTI